MVLNLAVVDGRPSIPTFAVKLDIAPLVPADDGIPGSDTIGFGIAPRTVYVDVEGGRVLLEMLPVCGQIVVLTVEPAALEKLASAGSGTCNAWKHSTPSLGA
jgi:hypothetical protein